MPTTGGHADIPDAVTERHWRYVGSGHTPGAALIATGIADDLAESRRLGLAARYEGVEPIVAPVERELQQSRRSLLPSTANGRTKNLIESEIVIIDDDGAEEPFDPTSWFE
ncbi:hypothetical protein [Streptomyces sp. NPDC057412]|uniref:hypothetical protein n=1 Tax=Streptomyces sp. NPDC057412 TaxID=3346123 RepID=UPI00369E40D0